MAARRNHPNQQILTSKIYYKSVYHRETLHALRNLQTFTQISEDDIALITLRLTFSDSPGPFEWGFISETICDLANELLQFEDWEPLTLHSSIQKEIPTQLYLDDNIPFAIEREVIIDVPINHWGYADVYIDNTTGLTINLPGPQNADKLEAAIPLMINMAARP